VPWYSGERGLTQLVRTVGAAVSDVRRVRRAWHWDTPRPHTWPEQGATVPERASDLGWARQEPVRTIRFLIQHGLLLPFTKAMAHPKVEGREWVRELERPVIFAANHSSHADTSLILYALTDRARERTVVAAAADYWFKRPLLGNIVSLFLNTFPFSRTGGAQAQLHSSSQLLKSGWNLVLFPEGSRSTDGRIREFKAGVGHLANETGTPVVPEVPGARSGARAHREADGAGTGRRFTPVHKEGRGCGQGAGHRTETTRHPGHMDRALASLEATRAQIRRITGATRFERPGGQGRSAGLRHRSSRHRHR
jgi:1-acyl-sn-glycerol-3-phosphate acyltransferase